MENESCDVHEGLENWEMLLLSLTLKVQNLIDLRKQKQNIYTRLWLT